MAKLLLIRLSALGDVMHCLPARARLREAWPGDELHFATRDEWAPEFEGHPHLGGGPGPAPEEAHGAALAEAYAHHSTLTRSLELERSGGLAPIVFRQVCAAMSSTSASVGRRELVARASQEGCHCQRLVTLRALRAHATRAALEAELAGR